MRIYSDLDWVLSDFNKHYCDWLGMPNHPPTEYNDERFKRMPEVAFVNEFWLSIPRLINPKDINFKISGYCTHRPCYNHIIEEWLRINGFPKGEILNTHELKVSKGEALKGKCDIFLDDNVEYFEDIRKHGIECYLMDASHNQHYETEYRVNNIKEFGEKISGNRSKLF
jgi:hypothetical protein